MYEFCLFIIFIYLLTALKTPAAFHEQIRSLERAKVRRELDYIINTAADHVSVDLHLKMMSLYYFLIKTGNFLKHKLCSRPERSELVRMHILQGNHPPVCSYWLVAFG